MSSLIDKLRAARLSKVEAGGHAYTIRRPTDAEASTLSSASGLDLVKRFVVGWGHTELSLGIPGGTDQPAPFDADLWAEWVADQPALWGPLADAIVDAYTAHAAQREDAAKN
ncbi:MAG: hypothetical protein ACRCVK_19770 [Aeromonas veronii]